MKKLFISCPMRGRTPEAIRESMEKMHRMAEMIVGEELEVIQSYIEGEPKGNEAVWKLGAAIQMLAEADVFIGIRYTEGVWRGCEVEAEVARAYLGREVILLNEEIWGRMMPDAMELTRTHWQRAHEVVEDHC